MRLQLKLHENSDRRYPDALTISWRKIWIFLTFLCQYKHRDAVLYLYPAVYIIRDVSTTVSQGEKDFNMISVSCQWNLFCETKLRKELLNFKYGNDGSKEIDNIKRTFWFTSLRIFIVFDRAEICGRYACRTSRIYVMILLFGWSQTSYASLPLLVHKKNIDW